MPRKPKKKMQLSEIYEKAADLLEKRGWCRHRLQSAEGSMCIWGAISQVVDGDPFVASTATHNMLNPISDILGTHAVHWNNYLARDKRQVVSILRRAAKAQAATIS